MSAYIETFDGLKQALVTFARQESETEAYRLLEEARIEIAKQNEAMAIVSKG